MYIAAVCFPMIFFKTALAEENRVYMESLIVPNKVKCDREAPKWWIREFVLAKIILQKSFSWIRITFAQVLCGFRDELPFREK